MMSVPAILKESIVGILSGFDRLVFRGSIRRLCYLQGMFSFLCQNKVLLKNFKAFSLEQTHAIRSSLEAYCASQGQQLQYLNSSSAKKEDIAREHQRNLGIRDGFIGAWGCVEPCRTYTVRGNRETKHLDLVSHFGQCLHLYTYWDHPRFGFMNARMQTWFPFNIQICLNGREILQRSLDAKGLSYEKRDNCFVAMEDWHKAQQLMDQQVHFNWSAALDKIADFMFPTLHKTAGSASLDYYWSTYQSEWATDLVFRDPQTLSLLYSPMVRHAFLHFDSARVMRFLGHYVTQEGKIHRRFAGECSSDIAVRHEGVRIKHWVGHNNIKMYDKQATLLRIETTINKTKDFKSYRKKEGQRSSKQWLQLRQGVADLPRRVQISQAANQRYLQALQEVHSDENLQKVTADVSRPQRLKNRSFRALDLAGKDLPVLKCLVDGRHALAGVRNRDLRQCLRDSGLARGRDEKQLAAACSRLLRLLRAHGLVSKIPSSHRYKLTAKGRKIVVAMCLAMSVPIKELARIAA